MSKIDRRQLLTGAATLAGGIILAGATDAGRSARAAQMPRIYTREEWGALPPDTTATIIGPPDHLVVHHTASENTTDYSLDQAFALSQWIQDLHVGNGWGDSGQQLTISRGGYIMEGRNRTLEALDLGMNVYGVQTANHNSHTLGIENEGIYVDADPTQQLWDSLVTTLAWLCELYGLDPHEAIVGHRDYVATQCPGDVFYGRLPELRNDVADSLGLLARERTTPTVRSGLPKPSAPFDHGPALGARERRP
ncbi:MAG: N-acetylmuramoyl-L-alanine amidase [Streptosporangiales bacterium]|nr:N-acetylmuramoyl-L-alanine amidase [Streptosporangiales bacterium]